MRYGLCNLTIVPMRAEPTDKSELVSQVLYGEHFKVLEKRKLWSKVRLAFDKYEGWIDNKQYVVITEPFFKELDQSVPQLSTNLVDFIAKDNGELQTIVIGSPLNAIGHLKHLFDGKLTPINVNKSKLIETAKIFLNTPYLWGGKTPFGIDCSGFTQLVYRLNGFKLKRDASQQAMQGEALSFIEESEAGDLAFFDNNEGEIIHVGLIMEDHYIIHAHGQVRIDRLDHTGIYNVDTKKHSHKLRVIKKII